MSIGERLRRVVARGGGGFLEPVLTGAYETVARTIALYLRLGNRRASVYATSSLATGEIVPAVSDLDLGVVVPAASATGAARQALERRRDRLFRLVPALGRLAWVAVYEQQELAQAETVCLMQPAAGPRPVTLFFGSPLADDLEVSSRPGFPGRVHTWRLLTGTERRSPRRQRSRAEDRVAAWLELQAWWRWAVQGCLEPDTPGRASLCVKLVAEPCRILLWLEHGEELPTRRAVLERARELVPSEEDAITEAIALRELLPRSPRPPLDRFVPVFLRLTQRIATLLLQELRPLGSSEVEVRWGGADELALSEESLDQLGAFTGEGGARMQPLADWRSLVAPTLPDECVAPARADAGDPAVLAAAARAGSPVAYAGLRAGEVLVLPPRDVYWLGRHRCVHFPASDPVSFALLDGETAAYFPQHPGWSIGDVAARAVAEHRAYLEAQLHEPGWDVQKLGCVLNAARAAVLAESVADGQPVLPLTMAATARELGERHPSLRGLAEEAAGAYRLHRRRGGGPHVQPLITRLASAVASLPVLARVRNEEPVSAT